MKTDFLVIGSGAAGLCFALKAAAHGHAGALYKLGEYCEHGLGGMTQDLGKARDYYARAAEKGSDEGKRAVERLKGAASAPAAEQPSAPTPATAEETPAPAESPKSEEKPSEEGKKKGGFFGKLFGK